MNNQVSPESKEAAIKTLAIIGFIVAIVVGIWLAVQIVRFLPTAFSSLASLAESVYGGKQILTIATDKTIVNSGEQLDLTWTRLRYDGTYTLSYRCVDGVSVETRTVSGALTVLPCEENLTLEAADQRIALFVTSEKKRFTDIPMTLSFIPDRENLEMQEKNALVTVVNAAIPQSGSVAGATDTPTATSTPETSTPTAPTTPATGGTQSSGTTYITKPVVTTIYPTSNPNGYADLKISYIGIGTFRASTGAFNPTTQIDNDIESAVRFEVKNIGTKTSGTWRFEADLFGYDFESSTQAALRPNERAVITLGFEDITDETGTEKITIEIEGGNDTNPSNNEFTRSIKVVD